MNYVTIYLLYNIFFFTIVIGGISPHTRNSSNQAIATQQKLYCRKILHNYFLQLLINKIHYVIDLVR